MKTIDKGSIMYMNLNSEARSIDYFKEEGYT